MAQEHECYCRDCAPERFPRETRSGRWGRSHSAVRFGDYGKVRLNGEEISLRVTECYAGMFGWAIVLSEDEGGRPHICKNCKGGICEYVLRGVVEFERGEKVSIS